MPLLAGVRRTIQRHHLAAPETRVVAAVSGGSDSVALVHLLTELHNAGDLVLCGVAHFNHQLREAAAADEAHCVDLAGRLGLPCIADRADVAALATLQRRSLEDAGRTARHAFFGRAATELHADVVALGHTRDDQAETFLLRLLRGAGARGLASMHPRNGLVIRPLLDCRRSELRAYLEARAIAYRSDETNEDVGIPRNRVRAELIPWLAERFNPAIVDILADEAAILQGQHAHLADEVIEWLGRAALVVDRTMRLDRRALAEAPLAVARAAMWQAMTTVAAPRAVAFADVERALDVALQEAPAFDGPGMRVERIADWVVLTGRPVGRRGRWRAGTGPTNLFEYSLSIPGEVRVCQTGVTVSAELASSWIGQPLDQVTVATVQIQHPVGHLAVRNRRPGDHFQPLGFTGRKKLQDFFTDRKVARALRDEVPLVVDAADRIVWVAGHAIDDAFRVKDPAQSVIILRLKGLGGSV